jgi:hypothetical protein
LRKWLHCHPLYDLQGLIALIKVPLYPGTLVLPRETKLVRVRIMPWVTGETYARLIMHVFANMALWTEFVFM